MAYTCAELEELAATTADHLMYAVTEAGLADAIRDTYVQCCREALAHVGVVPRSLDTEDFRRLRFEMLSFATFLVFGLLRKRVTKHSGLLRREADDAGIHYFQGELLRQVEALASDLGFQQIAETVLLRPDPTRQQPPEFGPGGSVTVADRVFQYLEACRREQGSELELFGKHIGLTLDPPHWPVLDIIGGTYGPMLLDVAQISIKASFGR